MDQSEEFQEEDAILVSLVPKKKPILFLTQGEVTLKLFFNEECIFTESKSNFILPTSKKKNINFKRNVHLSSMVNKKNDFCVIRLSEQRQVVAIRLFLPSSMLPKSFLEEADFTWKYIQEKKLNSKSLRFSKTNVEFEFDKAHPPAFKVIFIQTFFFINIKLLGRT